MSMSELECKVPEIVVPDDIISAVENELFASTSVETFSYILGFLSFLIVI